MNIIQKVAKAVFFLSQLYWIVWILVGIGNCVNGVDTGWLIPSLSNHTMIYGVDAIPETLLMVIIYTIGTPFICIPIYQIVYLVICIFLFYKHRRKG